MAVATSHVLRGRLYARALYVSELIGNWRAGRQ
jgi:hypothetical protein